MKKVILLILFFVLVQFQTMAQEQSEKEEKVLENIIDTIFEAMKNSDSEKIKPFFHPSAKMQTYVLGEGSRITSLNGPEAWWDAIDEYSNEVWDERVWDLSFSIHENLAQVQMNFAFYRDGDFSHCGENAFQFLKIDNKWKIIYIIDSRKTSGCEIPDKIKNY